MMTQTATLCESDKGQVASATIPALVSPDTRHVSPSPTERWQAWDDFLAASPTGGFMQTSWWADFRVDAGYEHFATILKDKTQIYGGAVVMKFSYSPTSCFYYIPDGPVLPEDEELAGEIFETILGAIDERRKTETQIVSHLRIEPRWKNLPTFVYPVRESADAAQSGDALGLSRGKGWRATPELTDCYREPRNTLCMDLRLSEDALLAQMKPKGRYNIRVAQRHGVQVVEDNSRKGMADFLRLYKRMTERKEINAKPASYFRILASMLFEIKHGSLYFAEYQGRRIAAAIVVYFGKQAIYFFGGSLVTDRNVMAPYLLHFEIMRRAKAMGYEWYDFWGVGPQDQPDHPWNNFSVFKRKFGGVEVSLVPTLDYVYDDAAYDHFMKAK